MSDYQYFAAPSMHAPAHTGLNSREWKIIEATADDDIAVTYAIKNYIFCVFSCIHEDALKNLLLTRKKFLCHIEFPRLNSIFFSMRVQISRFRFQTAARGINAW